MIREYTKEDLEDILAIWLGASVKAHDFVDGGYWESQVDNMRNMYIPASENYVYEQDSKVVGFYSLHEETLAAIFVSPEHQGQGVGTSLLNHAKSQRTKLSLSVYKENQASYAFYLSQGFTVLSEQADEHTGHHEYTMFFTSE
ncbi:Acetyltransferase, gnat family [Pseudodesulfovibrio profundus]|uniref:Acetyltransferase, gnat family n=1 Tax=Pseudodesulfovibrio profundus TaxID=57320 RepID=A0A2C8FDP5_9BACT|nr:N-acetyltransferase [Pseudodesulfovibrio profundus]MBC17437.1 N-acetyltransferase [Desulfovibrio sp.]MBC18221.1 N-acetyltransferase [Desulfovibrio sp.]SOB60661.1 Acetyltransferase, gnat family [Pseudodesulfovibrio profundus]|tara:strand:- start:1204 stop:1632 length:429 start_codon:yes stop_codon:yes gene_type:complete